MSFGRGADGRAPAPTRELLPNLASLAVGADADDRRHLDRLGYQLHDACKHGHVQRVRALLLAGAQPNTLVRDRRAMVSDTPLHAACGAGHAECVQLLLDQARTVGREYEDANMLGVGDRTPLHYACKGGHAMCAWHLLNAGTQPDARDVHGESPLHYACERGSAECVWRLLGCARVDARDEDQNTPLHVACRRGRVGCVRLLLGSGDIGVACARFRDTTGRTPLYVLAGSRWCDSAECARLLLAAGAEVDARHMFQKTPLHQACGLAGNAECARVLLEAGADVSAMDIANDTPLHEACRRGRAECVRLLLEWGAVNIEVSVLADNVLPSTLAALGGHSQCERLVRRATRLWDVGRRPVVTRAVNGVAVWRQSLDWTESTHDFLADEDRTLLDRALGALLLVDARREGGATLGREGALAFVASLARLMGV